MSITLLTPLTLDYKGELLKSVSINKDNSGTYVAYKPEKTGWHLWGVVSYVTYQLPNGRINTIYSNYQKIKI